MSYYGTACNRRDGVLMRGGNVFHPASLSTNILAIQIRSGERKGHITKDIFEKICECVVTGIRLVTNVECSRIFIFKFNLYVNKIDLVSGD